MSLTTIFVAFVLVAIVFNLAGWVTARWTIRGPASGIRGPERASPDPGPRAPDPGLRAIWPGATFEALILTLLAALWFGSLGHGGWPLVFLLVGCLAAGGDRWLRHRLLHTPGWEDLRMFALGLLKYLLAGLLLSWSLA